MSRTWEGRSAANDIESVRSLNEWSPLERHAPPTGRLVLDLQKIPVKRVLKSNAMRIIESNPHSPTIVSDIKRQVDMKSKPVLETQLKVLGQLSQRCIGQNDQAQKLLSLFRSCEPDQFGYIKKADFLKKIGPEFVLEPHEANRLLFPVHSKSSDEMNFLNFRQAFQRLDRVTEQKVPEYRSLVKRDPSWGAGKSSLGRVPTKNFNTMSKGERDAFRYQNKIQGAMEQSWKTMQTQFQRREGDGLNLLIRNKLSYPEIADVLKSFDIDIKPRELKELYHKSGDKGLTFSQLYNRTKSYFDDIDGMKPPSTAVRNKELKGQFLGCRALTSIEEKVGDVLDESHNEELWKAHWLEKTIPPRPRRAEKASVECVSRKMQKGSGDFLTWGNEVEDHPLSRNRSVDTLIDTSQYMDALISTSRTLQDTARTMNSSCSSLSTPWAVYD